ncbi:hypothetical protein ABGF26_02555 [Helcococcus ovis]|uniref:hypothetical protein n=1 Tax=Helcococcus ovis TaxID=72026 RepID=UPI0038B7E1DE
MFKIYMESEELEAVETLKEVKEILENYVKEDMSEDNYSSQTYSVYEDDEFYGYEEDIIDVDDLEEEYEGDYIKSNKYIEILENGEFSQDMIKDILYTVNKKAKNYRDFMNAYSNNSEFKHLYREAKANKKEMYSIKEDIIKHFPIVAIHRNSNGNYIEEEGEELITYLAVVDVFGYKAHKIIDEEEVKKLLEKGTQIEDTDFYNNGQNEKELLNDRVIELFMNKWNNFDKNLLKFL